VRGEAACKTSAVLADWYGDVVAARAI